MEKKKNKDPCAGCVWKPVSYTHLLTKISEYEQAPEDELYLNSVLDMRQPAGRGDKKIDGARQQMGMYLSLIHI